jgi:hypothetical protein
MTPMPWLLTMATTMPTNGGDGSADDSVNNGYDDNDAIGATNGGNNDTNNRATLSTDTTMMTPLVRSSMVVMMTLSGPLEEDHEQSQNAGLVPHGCVGSQSLLRVGEGGGGMCHGRWFSQRSS